PQRGDLVKPIFIVSAVVCALCVACHPFESLDQHPFPGDGDSVLDTNDDGHVDGTDPPDISPDVPPDGSCVCPAGELDCDCEDIVDVVEVDVPPTDVGCACPDFIPPDGRFECEDQQCVLVCDETFVDCNGTCVDPDTDAFHCGRCGLQCDSGVCENGRCRCNTTQQGNVCELCCENGRCVYNLDQCETCVPSCTGEESCCNGSCTQTRSDPFNCGMCGRNCVPGPGALSVECINGKCLDVCNGMTAEQCDTSTQACEPLDTPQNCGACGDDCMGTACVVDPRS